MLCSLVGVLGLDEMLIVMVILKYDQKFNVQTHTVHWECKYKTKTLEEWFVGVGSWIFENFGFALSHPRMQEKKNVILQYDLITWSQTLTKSYQIHERDTTTIFFERAIQ